MTEDQLNQIQAEGLPGNTVPTTIGALITNSLTYVFSAAAIALLIYLLLGGFQFMTSRGDPKAAQGAQGKITNAIIGFVIIIFAYFIVQIFGQVFGLQGTFFNSIFRMI